MYKWTSSECNHIYVGHTKNFGERQKAHLKNSVDGSEKLYLAMQRYGGWKMELLEEFYAATRREAEEVEERWRVSLDADLNMCSAYKPDGIQDEVSLSEMLRTHTHKQLKSMCKDRGLLVSGTKRELASRLQK